MNIQIQQLTQLLSAEMTEKESIRSELESEKELSEQYRTQRDELKNDFDRTQENLNTLQRNFELEQMSKMQIALALQTKEEELQDS